MLPEEAKKNIEANVSRETFQKFCRYEELLIEWNQKFNLVSESTLPQVWSRHFLDSAQLMKYIEPRADGKPLTLVDLGSGAGFPGLVLSIMGIPNVHLIESTGKKATFLQTVIDDLKLDAKVHHARIEDVRDVKPDYITARALGSLSDLLSLAQNKLQKETICLFLKGKSAPEELTESQKQWRFECDRHTSISDPSGTVLVIRGARFIGQKKRQTSR